MFFSLTRKRKRLPFFTNSSLKAPHGAQAGVPVPATRPWLWGSPPSSAPLFQLDGFPARSSRRNLGFWWGNAASAGEGRGGKALHFQCWSTTILASIPVIAATCWLSQPSPRSSPRSPSPLLGLLYSSPRPLPSPDMPFICFFRPRESCTRSASWTCKPSGEFPTHPEAAEKK